MCLALLSVVYFLDVIRSCPSDNPYYGSLLPMWVARWLREETKFRSIFIEKKKSLLKVFFLLIQLCEHEELGNHV